MLSLPFRYCHVSRSCRTCSTTALSWIQPSWQQTVVIDWSTVSNARAANDLQPSAAAPYKPGETSLVMTYPCPVATQLPSRMSDLRIFPQSVVFQLPGRPRIDQRQ
ncbi:hypothetical protein BaRGS_00020653 [Batillaria attramentaria]|uniref:Uncharacterized protein n=1 Tax=Batillaria attramentaria TaxID=370345 RepID=A0ABD0KLV3_9CAEN